MRADLAPGPQDSQRVTVQFGAVEPGSIRLAVDGQELGAEIVEATLLLPIHEVHSISFLKDGVNAGALVHELMASEALALDEAQTRCRFVRIDLRSLEQLGIAIANVEVEPTCRDYGVDALSMTEYVRDILDAADIEHGQTDEWAKLLSSVYDASLLSGGEAAGPEAEGTDMNRHVMNLAAEMIRRGSSDVLSVELSCGAASGSGHSWV